MDTQKKEKGKFRNSITFKLIVVAVLSLLLLIPSAMIRELIDERQMRRNETIREVTGKWGTSQEITGPVLIVPYISREYHSNGTYSDDYNYFHILPSELNIEGVLNPSLLQRSIYEVITYNSKLNLSGLFTQKELSEKPSSFYKILWNDARLVMGISDLRGVTQNIMLGWNDSTTKFSPGKYHCSLTKSGINAPVDIQPETDYSFKIEISLNGSESIFFTPVGSTTNVKLKGDWNTPSFDGSFLPIERNISETNFSAEWNIIEMNRSYPQTFASHEYSVNYDYQRFGVKLLLPVDTYQKSERSVKYAFLFIALTFLVVFFSEVLSKKRVHPVQYLNIGLGLVIFYSLLIALAEHISFNIAYLISSLVIIGMISVYIQAIFKKWKTTISITAGLTVLYLFLFTILQIADYALLLGNIGLVIILGAVMFYSKKVDWYGDEKPE
jgi:inner membrane protein